MVVITRLRYLAGAFLLTLPLAAAAEPAQPDARLSDAWLGYLQGSERRVTWSHAFALRDATADQLVNQRSRLLNEHDTLRVAARVAGNATLTRGLAAWRETLADVPALPARTPGRHDLPWLGANLRQDPALERIRHWGHCEVPGWVEIWHPGGVARLEWRAGMNLDSALNRLPAEGHRGTDRAMVITPSGEQVDRGIAAWNHQATPLSPGSRVLLALPQAGERRGALPASVRQEISLVNERLPAYLATRLPGDDCTLQGKGEEE